MFLALFPQQDETVTQFAQQSSGVIALHGQSTALQGAIVGECRPHRKGVRLDGSQGCLHMGLPLRWFGEEVERSTVVPQIHTGRPEGDLRDVDDRSIQRKPVRRVSLNERSAFG